MKPGKKEYTPEFRLQVALEAIREREPVAAIAKKFGISPTLVTRWQKKAEAQLPRVFEAKKSVVELQRELAELEKEYRWLKAKYDGYLETLGEERSTGKK